MPSWRLPTPSLITSFVIIYRLISGVLLAKCPSSWTSSDATCIKAFEIVKDYPDAKAYCYRQGGTLARITTEKERHVKELIGNLQQKDAPFWVALDESESHLASGFVKHGHWPLEIEFEYHGDDKVCVKLKPGDEGYERDSCSQESPYFCEVYVGNQGVCPKGWELYHREDACIGYMTQPKTWGNALLDCKSFGGELVHAWNNEKRYFMIDISDMNTTRTQSAWVGIWKNTFDESYRFIDSFIINLQCPTPWQLGDVIPGKDSDHCMVVGKRQRGLVKESCYNTHYFFCQKFVAGPSLCVLGWHWVDWNVCIKEIKQLKTWEDAHTFCRKEAYSYLVLIESQHSNLLNEKIIRRVKSNLLRSIKIATLNLETRQAACEALAICEGTRDNATCTRFAYEWEHVRSMDGQVYWIENNDMDRDGVWEWKHDALDHRIPMDRHPETDNVDAYCLAVGRNHFGLQWDNCYEKHYFFCETELDDKKGCEPPLIRYHDEKLCVREFKLNKTWYEANEFCQKTAKTRLAVLEDEDEFVFLIGKVRTSVHVDYWIYNKHVNTDTRWTKVFWENLFPSTPTIPNHANPQKDNCVRMEAHDRGFKRTSCHSRYYFICEKDMENYRCPEGWITYPKEQICMKSHHIAKNYLAARTYCRECCRDLVEILDAGKRNAVRDAASEFVSYPHWVGFQADWKWATESMSHSETKWPMPMIVQSNGKGKTEDDCIALERAVNTYRIHDCSDKLYFVCEMLKGVRGWCNTAKGWHLYEKEDVCIKVIEDGTATFKGANVKCRSQDAELVRVWNNEKEYFIKERTPRIIVRNKQPLWVAMRRDSRGKYLMGSKTIVPVNPGSLEFSDIALIEERQVDGCVVIGQDRTGIIRKPCLYSSHYIMCERPAKGSKCSRGWSLYRNERVCVKAFNRRDRWRQSSEYCQRQGGQLVNIKTMNKLKFVRGKRGGNEGSTHWTSFRDTDGDGVLEYPDGELYFPLASDAPPWQHPFQVRDKNECVKTEGEHESEYTARGCNSKNYFICEKDPHHYDDL